MKYQHITICACFAVTLSAASLRAQTAPAAAPAGAPAAVEAAIKSAMIDFVHAMTAGDDKTLFDALVFTDPAAKTTAETLFKPQLARERLENALNTAFPNDPAIKDLGLGPAPDELRKIETDINTSTVAVTGDTAILAMKDQSSEKMTLVKVNGQWKIDFDKTQKEMGNPPGKRAIAEAAAQVKIIDAITADVAAKKYHSPADAQKDMESRLQTAMKSLEAAPAPAEKP